MPLAYTFTYLVEPPSVFHRGSSFIFAFKSHRATSIAPIASFIIPSFPPLNTASIMSLHNPLTPLGSFPTTRGSNVFIALWVPGLLIEIPERPSSVSIYTIIPDMFLFPVGKFASPMRRSNSKKYGLVRIPVTFISSPWVNGESYFRSFVEGLIHSTC